MRQDSLWKSGFASRQSCLFAARHLLVACKSTSTTLMGEP
jgi:hypothetical protein